MRPEQTGEFDAALTTARRTPHLDQLRDTLPARRRVALLTRQDPDAQDQIRSLAPEALAAVEI